MALTAGSFSDFGRRLVDFHHGRKYNTAHLEYSICFYHDRKLLHFIRE